MIIEAVDTWVDDYSMTHCVARNPVSTEKFLEQLHGHGHFVVNSIISKGWFGRRTHVLLLDCDGTAQMLGACHWLAAGGIGYGLIQSSPSRYWVVVDKIGRFSDLHYFAVGIPGVDKDFLDQAYKHDRFFLRACPSLGRMAIFEDADKLTASLAKKWYLDFRTIWEAPEMKRRHLAELMKLKIDDGSIFSEAANPEFQL